MKDIEDVFSVMISGEPRAELDTPGEKFDEGTGTARFSLTIDKKPVKFYPWGKDNKLPHKMMELVRSNGDVANSLETRADFLYGSGIGIFIRDDKGEPKAFFHQKVKEFWMAHNMDDVTDAGMTQLVYTGHAYINISCDLKRNLDFTIKDSLTVRAEEVPATSGRIGNYILSSKWDSGNSVGKSAVLVPAFDYNDFYALPESILNLHKPQPGQFYYNHPQWWSLEKHIKLAIRIFDIYNNNLDTEGNIGMIMRVSKKVFDDLMAQNLNNPATNKPYTRKELVDAFKKTADAFVFGQQKNKILFDECGVNDKGELEKYIEFEPVPKTLTGEDYNRLYTAALTAINNASGMLGGLSGVSDGKMNSGGGTEIRQSALYQQFYRTPRERKLLLNFLNRVFMKYMREKLTDVQIPEGAFFDFKNIVLETLDKNPTGMQTVKGNAN